MSLPTGTVTLLFTDVEGSTRLLAEHGDSYADLLAEHRRLLREAFDAHGGMEVDTQGDAFFYAFAGASDAAAAALAGQAALAATPVRVRMGLHTGEPQRTADGYVGMDVHVGARIAAAGHGGQVLVSEQTAHLLPGLPLRDLGDHGLKDVGRRRLFQLGDGEFPPPKTLHQTNLPRPATPLVGRKKELVDVVRLLAIERVRIVTLTGPGGIGKTRFSLAAAAEVGDAFADGVWFVDASSLRDASLVVPTIASELRAEVPLTEHIGAREVLLVIDNLEHVIEAATDLGGLTSACPSLQLLVTSREPLRIAGELEYAIKPLPEAPAVDLFRQRAAARGVDDVDFTIAAQICERLDRVPLAIELAAARVKVLEPGALLARLAQRLPILAGGARDVPERQRSLSAAIAWSHELLDADEQQLFRRLAVFSGGCTLEAAENVCEADLGVLEALVDKSLLRRRDDRFVMLETIREFAAERLQQAADAATTRRSHAEYYLLVVGSANLRALDDGPQDHERVAQEQDNLRAALDWTLAADEVELGLQLVVAAENFWVTRATAEGFRRTRELLDRADDRLDLHLRADALRTCASTSYIAGDFEEGLQFIEESLHLYRQLGDDRATGHMEFRLAVERFRTGDLETGADLVARALESARRTGYRRGEAMALQLAALKAFDDDRPDEGMELLERSAAVAGEIGFTWWQSGSLFLLATHAIDLGRLADAERSVWEGLELNRRMGDRQGLVHGLAILAAVHARSGRADLAGRFWGAVEGEEARGRVGQWEEARDAFFARHLVDGDEEFERGRAEGRLLTLDEALDVALSEGS